MADNYGELVKPRNPRHVGADIVICGSLMKNLGGGIAPTDRYVSNQTVI